ncbi:MAG: NAD(P)/FAD-dependent oxidoreductase [Candidatus Micrarchaeota archaeon]
MPETVYDSKVYQLAVIGAGPAGLSAAYNAAKEGVETIILEEHKKVGEPVHCGECLSKIAAERIKLQLPPDSIAQKVKGIRVVFPDGTDVILREEGYALHKEIFEQYLAVRAQGAGATLRTGVRILGMARKEGIWSLNSSVCAIKANVVIDASGYESVSNKLTKINQKKFEIINGAQYLIENVQNDGFIEFFLWPRLAPHGYLWIIPKGEGRANVGIVSNDPKTIHKNLKKFLKEKALDKSKIIRPFGGAIPSSGPFPRTHADGILLAGDAAGFTSPMFEGGTQLALKSGELAGQTIANIVKDSKKPKEKTPEEKGKKEVGDLFLENSLKPYEAAWKKEFPPYPKLLKANEHFYQYNEQELNQIAKILPEDLTSVGIGGKLKIGVRLITQAPKLATKNFSSAMKAFSYSTGKNYGW